MCRLVSWFYFASPWIGDTCRIGDSRISYKDVIRPHFHFLSTFVSCFPFLRRLSAILCTLATHRLHINLLPHFRYFGDRFLSERNAFAKLQRFPMYCLFLSLLSCSFRFYACFFTGVFPFPLVAFNSLFIFRVRRCCQSFFFWPFFCALSCVHSSYRWCLGILLTRWSMELTTYQKSDKFPRGRLSSLLRLVPDGRLGRLPPKRILRPLNKAPSWGLKPLLGIT